MVPGALVTHVSVPLLKLSQKALCVLVLACFVSSQSAAFALDLNSTSRSIPAPVASGRTATIVVGGRPQVVDAGQLVTPAQAVAIGQIAGTGRQNLIVGTAGNAVGGNFSLTSLPAGILAGLSVPRAVTALSDFGNSPVVDVGGSLTNSGHIYAFSTNTAQTMATIGAKNIVNTTGGIMSSILPTGLLPANALSRLDLNLQATGSVVNEGTISSSGSLVIGTADGAIQNRGLIYAQNGNIDLQSSNTGHFAIDSRNGTVHAENGSVNVAAPNLSIAGTLSITGGDWLSNELNLNAAKGEVRGALGEVSGWVNIKASAANFGAATSNLKLASITTDGDPTYFNTLGSLTLANLPNTAGAALALLASQDVVVTAGVIDTTNHSGGNGGALTVIAGANFSTLGSSTTGDTSTTVTIAQSALPSHGSATGGAIDLSGVTAINTNGTMALNASGFNGGDIKLVAFSGTGIGSTLTPGSINLGDTGSIVTAGAGGTNGDILVVAGATSDPAGSSAVILPAMFTGWSPMNSQAGTSGGDVVITTATPVLSGNVNIRNGAILNGSGTISGAAVLQPTSVLIGSQGGTNNGTIAQSSSLTQWQLDAANYALAEINQFRVEEGVAIPLQLDPMLMRVATSEAQYMAQTQHFAHITLNGATMTDRYSATGINVFAIGSYGENVAYSFGSGNTAKQAFDGSETFMENEPPGQPNHRANLTSFRYVGIGFASVGNVFYIVENFSDNAPALADPNLVVPAYGGVQGGAGMVAVSPTSKTLPSIGSSGVLPTSINAAGAGITINAGAKLTSKGALLTNGISDVWQRPAAGEDGGPVSINATGDVNLFGIQSTGGLGGAAFQGSSATNGGRGGNVSVTSLNGSINILPGSPCAPCLAVATSGGAGGQSLDSNRPGGNGGAAGDIALSAPNGSINITALDAGGGGGSGGSGGTTGGAGGAGGAGGDITLTALNNINVSYYINASGGGGGGAGGVGAGGSGGGGGAALAMGGGGGASGGSTAGGGGGALSELPGFGGPSFNFLGILGSAGQSGTGGATGGAAGLFGGGGGAGVSNGGAASQAGAGGGLGQPGGANGTGTISGGAGGAGGSVVIDAKSLQMLGTPATFWTRFTTASTGTNSILALGANGTVDITTAGSPTTVLNADANYGSTTKNITVDLSSSFGNIVAGSQTGSITLNGNAVNSPFSGGTGGSGSITITENGAQVTFNSGASVTPSEWAAILQVRSAGTQTIQLDALGTAIGGTLTLSSNNVPDGGFNSLVIPVGLTVVNSVPSLTYAAGMIINGTFDASVQTGATTVSTPSLTLNGSLIGSGGGLTIQSTAANFPLNVGPSAQINLSGGTISGTTLSINNSLNPLNLCTAATQVDVTSTGDVNVTNTGSVTLGNISAPNFSVTASPSATITTTQNITTAGVLSLTASSIVNNNALVASQINLVGNNTTGNFTVGGAGAFTSTSGTSLVSTFGNLEFAPSTNLTFNGNTVISANGVGQSLVFGSGASLINNGVMSILTSTAQGAFPITGNGPTTLLAQGKGTIANPNGDVVLPSGFTFIGSDLAILASGNVRATGATTLNLSNSKGDAGDLTIIAGYNFTGNASDPTYKTASTGLYTIGTENPAGGSIYLPKASINLSTTAVGKSGGRLTAIANGGTWEAGMVALGAINTSAVSGTAGSVNIIGEGGIHSGAINASGRTGASVSLIGAAPVVPAGMVSIANGTLNNAAAVTNAATSSANGAAILVTGNVSTNGSKDRAGDVTMLSDAQIGVTGGITANGLQTSAVRAGGNVSMTSGLDVSVKGAISSNALSASSATASGDAGTIAISAGALIKTGALQAIGGKNTGTGSGGKGGAIALTTQKITVGGLPVGLGSIKVAGTIDARGGDASKTLGANGGVGGTVDLDAGAVAVVGSINASGGVKGTGTTGGDGSVGIDTYAIQSLPTSFDLTSSTRNIVALPGSLFTLGLSTSPNGVSGTIKVGTTTVDKKQNPQVTAANGVSGGPVTITVHGGPSGALNSAAFTAFDVVTGNRALVTPAEALALYQTSHAGNAAAQTFALAANGSLVTPAPSADISLPATELNSATFTAFKLPTGVRLQLQGARPVLSLPSSAVLAGTIDFPTAGSTGYINAGSGAFNLQSTGSITSTGTVILSGTNSKWTNNGTIQVGTLVLARPSSAAMTFVTADGAETTATVRLAPTADVGMTMTFKAAPSAQLNMPIEFGAIPMPAVYAAASTATAANAGVARNVSLTFDMPGFSPTVGGMANVESIKLTALNTTPLNVQSNASFIARKTIAITAGGGGITTGGDVTMQSGVLAASAPGWNSAALLTSKQITSAGGITIKSAGTVGIGSDNTFTANGGNVLVMSSSGNVNVANDNTFRAMGGNVSAFAAGTINGGTGNKFQAKGTTSGANGGIEFGSGTNTATLTSAFAKKSGTQLGIAPLTAGGLTNVAQTKGALVVNPLSKGTAAFGAMSSMTMNSGAVVFDLIAPGVGVDFGAATTFETKASKPINYMEAEEETRELEFVLETQDD